MPTKITPIRIPLELKLEIYKRTNNLSKWVIELIKKELK
jgi:hypothetical protein